MRLRRKSHTDHNRVVNDALAHPPKQIVYRRLSALKPAANNARVHGHRQIAQLAKSILGSGFINPIIIDEQGTILAGHGRYQAAQSLGLEAVPTLLVDHLTEAQKRAYRLADNRIAENASWDRNLLKLELSTLVDLDLDIELTGFDTGEVDLLLDGESNALARADPADDLPDVTLQPIVSRTGDLWLLGQHRLICGDALDKSTYGELLRGEKASLVFVDPPYNVPIDGFVGGKGGIHHPEFAMASGEMTERQFVAFLTTALGHLAFHSTRASVHFVCMDWRHQRELLAAAGSVYTKQLNVCVWVKSNAGMGSLYRSQHELVFVFQSGAGKPINNVNLGVAGRNRTNIWTYPGINAFGHGRTEKLALHPTVKPVALVADAMRDCSKRGGLVLDSFAGSGTTIIAAERTGRVARTIEIEPRYVDVAVRRWEGLTGRSALHAATNQTFEELTRVRAVGPSSDS